jgi:formamidopyrimidine-DNA glycosylase
MPELPEVQTIVNDLQAAGLVGKCISRAQIYWQRTVATDQDKFIRELPGREIRQIQRRGKFIIFELTGNCFMLIHLRMSGRLHIVRDTDHRDTHERLSISFTDGSELRLHDTRKFARAYLVNDQQTIVGRLGPEPLDESFRAPDLAMLLNSHARMIKPLLLDQSIIAGLGNIYVDESLWEARIHPCRLANTLTNHEAGVLYRAIRKVLRQGLRNLGTTLGRGHANFYSLGQKSGRNKAELKVFRRTGEACPRCGDIIQRIAVGQRSTHLCAHCQPQ